MPMPSMKYRKTNNRRHYWAKGVIAVDVRQVEEVLDRAVEAVSPPSLMFFLQGAVSPYMREQIIDRFADEGDDHPWAPLKESTRKIKDALGIADTTNVRSGALLKWITTTREYKMLPYGASMQIPGEPSTTELQRKLMHAQFGGVQGPNDLMPGAVTPPRIVLDFNGEDLAAVTVLLQSYIMTYISLGLADMGSLSP